MSTFPDRLSPARTSTEVRAWPAQVQSPRSLAGGSYSILWVIEGAGTARAWGRRVAHNIDEGLVCWESSPQATEALNFHCVSGLFLSSYIAGCFHFLTWPCWLPHLLKQQGERCELELVPVHISHPLLPNMGLILQYSTSGNLAVVVHLVLVWF